MIKKVGQDYVKWFNKQDPNSLTSTQFTLQGGDNEIMLDIVPTTSHFDYKPQEFMSFIITCNTDDGYFIGAFQLALGKIDPSFAKSIDDIIQESIDKNLFEH